MSAPESPSTSPLEPKEASGREIQVLYFAALRDQTGRADERLALPPGPVVVADVLRILARQHASLSLEAVRVALNEEFTDAAAPVAPGDVLALIPPVSGG